MFYIQIYNTVTLGGITRVPFLWGCLKFCARVVPARVAPGSCPEVRLGIKMYLKQIIWKIVTEIYAPRCCCHMGKDQNAGAFVYFGHMLQITWHSKCPKISFNKIAYGVKLQIRLKEQSDQGLHCHSTGYFKKHLQKKQILCQKKFEIKCFKF